MAKRTQWTITADECREQAVKCMEECMAYMAVGDRRWAMISYGRADVWENLYYDITSEYLDEVDERYATMQNIYGRDTKDWF